MKDSMQRKVDYISAFTSAGFPVIPLRGKMPITKGWKSAKPGDFSAADIGDRNYGVVIPDGVLVVDVDPRNFQSGDHPLKRLISHIDHPIKDTLTVKTGSGGLHVYLRVPKNFLAVNELKNFQGIEFKGVGRQVVGPGSIHPDTGRPYEIVGTAGADLTRLAFAPPKLLELIQRPTADLEPSANNPSALPEYDDGEANQKRYREYLETAAPTSGTYRVACRGRDFGLSPEKTWSLMVEVWSPRRTGKGRTSEEIKDKVIHAYLYARSPVGNSNAKAVFPDAPAPAPAHKKKEEPAQIAWNLGKQGELLKTFHNLMNFFRDPAFGLSHLFALNEFTGRVEFRRPAPWHSLQNRSATYREGKYPPVGDADLRLLKGWLSTRCGYEASLGAIEDAVTNVAYSNRMHPVRDYIKALKWDGKERLDFWLQKYLGVMDGLYVRACSRKVLTAAVARVFEPGIKFDHVLILEGDQGIGKSSAIEILGAPWFSDAPVDPHSRDTVDAMQGCWIVELAEMVTYRRAEMDALRAFVSRRVDRARLAYGRSTGDFPRQSIFIASMNPGPDETYLRDDTGARRWWPVRCRPSHGPLKKQVDFEGLREVRDQLFAEAYVRYKNEEPLKMETPELEKASRTEGERRFVEHEWTEIIAEYISRQDRHKETKRDFYTSREIYKDALLGVDRGFDRKSQMGIALVMRQLGWQPAVKWIAGRAARGYERPECSEIPESDDEKLRASL